jgi:hypothetical protein
LIVFLSVVLLLNSTSKSFEVLEIVLKTSTDAFAKEMLFSEKGATPFIPLFWAEIEKKEPIKVK